MSVKEAVQDLTKMVLSGQGMEAFEKYYADDVEMQENESPPRKGKEANRKFEQEWMESIKEFHGAEVKAVAVEGDTAIIEWFMDFTLKDGKRKKMSEVAVQQWKDGKIVREKFYYDSAAGA